MSKNIYLDESGYQEFLDYIDKLINDLKECGKEMGESYRDYVGDGWHDNPAYEAAQVRERRVSSQIQHFNNLLSDIEIIKPTKFKDKVNINDVVEIKLTFKDGSSDIEKYKLLGSYFSKEEDNITGISINSLLGSAIYKKKIGSTVSYELDNGNIVNAEILNKIED